MLLRLCEPAIDRGEEGEGHDSHDATSTASWAPSSAPRSPSATERRAFREDTIDIKFVGSAGQSFGAFLPPRRHAQHRGRFERPPGQGPLRREDRRLPASQFALQAGGEHHHRQCGFLRRHLGRGLRMRHGGRALLRAQLGPHGGRRGRGRSCLRIHDRRQGGHSGAHRAQLRRGHVGRRRLRVRCRRQLPLAHNGETVDIEDLADPAEISALRDLIEATRRPRGAREPNECSRAGPGRSSASSR